jgi:uncharacterized protein (DUF302 family)
MTSMRKAMSIHLVTKRSPHTFEVTGGHLERAIHSVGAAILGRVDHAAGAASVGLTLRPTTVWLFGNPKAGTPLMQQTQTVGLDLPLHVLVWQDDRDAVWLTFRDPAGVARDHGIPDGDARVAALASALQTVTDEAIRP